MAKKKPGSSAKAKAKLTPSQKLEQRIAEAKAKLQVMENRRAVTAKRDELRRQLRELK